MTLTVGTQAGRTLSRSVLLPVLALAAPSALAASLQVEGGASVLDQNGQPLDIGA